VCFVSFLNEFVPIILDLNSMFGELQPSPETYCAYLTGLKKTPLKFDVFHCEFQHFHI